MAIMQPSWIADRNDFSYFLSTLPRYILPSFESTGLLVREKIFKIALQDGGCGSQLWFFFIRKTLTIFINKSPRYFLQSFG